MSKEELILHGIGVSPGVASAPVFRVVSDEPRFTTRMIGEDEVTTEVTRFLNSLTVTRQEIKEIQQRVAEGIGQGDASIFDAHLMLLDDRMFIEEVIKGLGERRQNAEAIVQEVAAKHADVFSKISDSYLRERVADLRDVARRILHNLIGSDGAELDEVDSQCVVVAADLAPSQTAALQTDLVVGFATNLGSPTSHTAVMARAIGIPAVVGLHDVTAKVQPGDLLLMDGNKGMLVINPSQERLDEYGHRLEVRQEIATVLRELKDQPAETKDGRRIDLRANIESTTEIEEIHAQGAHGVGLFRSEFLFLSKRHLPTEEEQAVVYAELAERLAPERVTIRTLDLGGDKFLSHVTLPSEMNPFLGWRAIRLCLAQPEMFLTQLRAILRASRHGNIEIMYPMITTVDEVREANGLLDQAKGELREAGEPFDEQIRVGVMIETPAAAMIADVLAEHVDFFSIGTNDLVQYTLAVDRVNERVAYLYEPTHPAILRLIRHTVEAGKKKNLKVSLCGEMAGDPLMTPLLVGLGISDLSLSPSAVPLVKDAVRSIRFKDAEKLAKQSAKASTASEVVEKCREMIRKTAPEILELVD